jgi:ABC-type bacteriocin/lantibiotic exporter with double-glycine peptidase domain
MLSVKPLRQKPNFCGVASLKMVLDYFGCDISEKKLIELTGATPQKGTSGMAMKAAAEALRFSATIKDRADFKDIQLWLAKKVPPIVDWFHEGDGHYSVAVALDKNYIFLQDPEIAGIRKIKRADFKRVWFDFEGDFMCTKNDLILRRLIVIAKK